MVERLSIDRRISTDRSAKVYKESQRDRQTIAAYKQIDRAFNDDRDRVIVDRSVKSSDAKRQRFLDF